MRLLFELGGVPFAASVAAGAGVEAALPIVPRPPPPAAGEASGSSVAAATAPAAAVSAFWLPAAEAAPVVAGSWVGAVDAGASVNCVTLSACVHGCGTHTECCGHVLPGRVALGEHVPLPRAPFAGLLVSVTPTVLPHDDEAALAAFRVTYPTAAAGDRVIDGSALEAGLAAVVEALQSAVPPGVSARDTALAALRDGALALRTRPNSDDKRHAAYSGTNPPYVGPDVAAWARRHGVAALLLDLPSVDREVRAACDGG